MIKTIAIAVLLGVPVASQTPGKVDFYSAKNLSERTAALDKKGTPFAGEDLSRYGNHYTMLAYRTATGSSEVHEHEADIFVIESGSGTLVEGGKLVNPKTAKPGEIRGSSVAGGTRMAVAKGDVVHIPAGVPHQLLIDKGTPVSYSLSKSPGNSRCS